MTRAQMPRLRRSDASVIDRLALAPQVAELEDVDRRRMVAWQERIRLGKQAQDARLSLVPYEQTMRLAYKAHMEACHRRDEARNEMDQALRVACSDNVSADDAPNVQVQLHIDLLADDWSVADEARRAAYQMRKQRRSEIQAAREDVQPILTAHKRAYNRHIRLCWERDKLQHKLAAAKRALLEDSQKDNS